VVVSSTYSPVQAMHEKRARSEETPRGAQHLGLVAGQPGELRSTAWVVSGEPQRARMAAGPSRWSSSSISATARVSMP